MNEQKEFTIKFQPKIIAVVLVGLALVYFMVGFLFKSAVESKCNRHLSSMVDCGCVADVINSDVSFMGKVRVLVSGDVSKVVKDVSLMGVASCTKLDSLFK